jgi:hypothetical protein
VTPVRLPRLFRRKRKMMTISAVVTRADGRVENLGVISKGKVEFTPEAK